MRIAFIGDQKGKVQYGRWQVFCKYFSQHQFDFFTIREKRLSRKCSGYDIVYYASFTSYRRRPVKHKRIYGSATSWKCTKSKRDLRSLKKFTKVSANNFALCEALKKRRSDIVYLPNGVDTHFFTPGSIEFDPAHLKIGWVGNQDREEKNYNSIFIPVKDRIGKKLDFVTIATSKSARPKRLHSPKKMRKFYRNLHFYLITSSYEGTPNPALEAAACGIPLITTEVGNMPQIVKHRENGFFVKCKVKSVINRLLKLRKMTPEHYRNLKLNIRREIEKWDWAIACKQFATFFGT